MFFKIGFGLACALEMHQGRVQRAIQAGPTSLTWPYLAQHSVFFEIGFGLASALEMHQGRVQRAIEAGPASLTWP